MTRSRRFFASSPWIATGTPDYVNLGYTSRGLAKQALMRLPRKSLTLFRKLGLEKLIANMKSNPGVWFATLEQIATHVKKSNADH